MSFSVRRNVTKLQNKVDFIVKGDASDVHYIDFSGISDC